MSIIFKLGIRLKEPVAGVLTVGKTFNSSVIPLWQADSTASVNLSLLSQHTSYNYGLEKYFRSSPRRRFFRHLAKSCLGGRWQQRAGVVRI